MHTIQPSSETVHGYWDKDLPPILTIQSGESVRYQTLAANWSAVNAAGTLEMLPYRPTQGLVGHGMCGPIAIEGAKAGMMLEIRIDAIIPATRGYNRGAGRSGSEPFAWFGTDDVEEEFVMNWEIDPDAGTSTSASGHRVKNAPFMGVMGMAWDETGQYTTTPPRRTGGNIDCKELLAGTTLYLPVAVDGGLFSVGDGHAAQGDGEMSGTAIECPMQQVDLTFTVRDDLHYTAPMAAIRGGMLAFGFDPDLDAAVNQAGNAMLDFMVARYKMSRKEALALGSVVMDLRVTQIVNQVKGAHAILWDDSIEVV